MSNSRSNLNFSLPGRFYFDPAHYLRELETFWYRRWIYACRADSLAGAGSFRVVKIGTQSIILVRDGIGELHAFHNTCRHRGSTLCTDVKGCFTRGHIVCPYHRWTYSLEGDLIGVPIVNEEVPRDRFPLYRVRLQVWGGFVFVNLSESEDDTLEQAMDPSPRQLADWPLADLTTGHVVELKVHCNWKVFWENFLECYHCPGIHPELCDLVPLYRRGLTSDPEDPDAHARLRDGAESWSVNGRSLEHRFSSLSPSEQGAGQTFLTVLPSMFVVAHRDYVRCVSILPVNEEEIQLRAEWLFPRESLEAPDVDLKNVTDFASVVLEQDARACELNQRGLKSIRYDQGVLTSVEADVLAFQDWVRVGLSEPETGAESVARRRS